MKPCVYRSHASAHRCVIAAGFSMVIANSPPPSLKWKRRGWGHWAALRAQHHGYSPEHGRVNRWEAERAGSRCRWQLHRKPRLHFQFFFENDPSLLLPSSFIWAPRTCYWMSLSSLLTLHTAHINRPIITFIYRQLYDFSGNHKFTVVSDLHLQKDYYEQVHLRWRKDRRSESIQQKQRASTLFKF